VLRRGAGNISGYAGEPPYGIDVPGLVSWAAALAGQLDEPSPDASPARVPRLCRS
jgi:hypothetical protein